MAVAPLVVGGLTGLLVVLLPLVAPLRSDVIVAQPETPEAAIAAFVVASGGVYAGPCEETRSPEDIGKICSRFIVERGTLSSYLIGRTFSEFDRWLFVERSGVGWSVVADAPLDFHAQTLEPPWPR
jgi:hypothetical protein